MTRMLVMTVRDMIHSVIGTSERSTGVCTDIDDKCLVTQGL